MADSADIGKAIIAIKDRVVANFKSSDWKELGTLLNQYHVVIDHDRLLRSLSWGDPDYEEKALDVLQTLAGRRGTNLGAISDFVESKYPQGELVSTAKKEGRRITFIPTVFQVPDGGIEEDLVSVMMPFHPSFDRVYESIREAAGRSGMRCLRVDDIWEDTTVIQDVFSLIFRARIVVCDFTDKNPNVFYEAGIAHTLGKDVVPITQSKQDIPFDLQHHRYLGYLNNAEGLGKLCLGLTQRFGQLLS